MIKSFKVAGHVFSLKMADDNPRWGLLGQYDPFEVSGNEASEFTLEVVDSLGLPEAAENGTRNVPGAESLYRTPREKGEPTIDLFSLPSGDMYFEMSPVNTFPVCAWMISDSTFSRARLEIGRCRDRIFGINNSLMLLFAFRTASESILEMHASVIKYQGRGYLFLGHSGAGKSTHSRQWLSAFEGAELLNDDNPIVGVGPDGAVTVYGSPWSGKTPCYKNDSCPVAGFVKIIQYPENKIKRISVFEAYAAIYSSSSGYKADEKMADGLHSTMEKVVTTIPCYELQCLPDENAARVCYKAVSENE